MQPEHPATPPAAKLAAVNLPTDVEPAASLQSPRSWRWRRKRPRYAKLGEHIVRYWPASLTTFIESRVDAA